jgi:hypothetical protein
MEVIRNKVAESGIITLDPARLLPETGPLGFDLQEYLFHGFVLREKEFRQQLKEKDWSACNGRLVALYCSTDAIIASWAWMLVTRYVVEAGGSCIFGNPEMAAEQQCLAAVATLDVSIYAGERVILKGCGDKSISPAVYTALTGKLVPVVKSLMYGEPCSTVPVFKKT